MAIKLTLPNIFQLFSTLSPFLLTFFLVMLSIFNTDIKAIVYLSGLLISSILNIFLINHIKSPVDNNESFSCNIIDIPYLSEYNSPSLSALFISFTLSYLSLPMIYNNQFNYPVLATLLIMLGSDVYNKIINKCTTIIGSVYGSLIGLLFGVLWYILFMSTGNDNLLYFGKYTSNNVQCSKPSKQTFKCSVYKNGRLISRNIA